MVLFLLAEHCLKLPQILCEIDLKTDRRMHYHSADGVYAGVTPDGILKLYWGESKLYKDIASGIRACLSSLAPFLVEPERLGAECERDIILLSDKADLSDPAIAEAIKRNVYNKSTRQRRFKYCSITIFCFASDFYNLNGAKAIAD